MGIIDLKQEIVRFTFEKGEYAIFGSGTLLALEIIHDIKDIDIVVSKREFNRLATLLKTKEQNSIIYESGAYKIEIFKEWMGFDVDRIIREAIIIDGISYASLLYVVLFKHILNRSKDIEHINKIRKYLS